MYIAQQYCKTKKCNFGTTTKKKNIATSDESDDLRHYLQCSVLLSLGCSAYLGQQQCQR